MRDGQARADSLCECGGLGAVEVSGNPTFRFVAVDGDEGNVDVVRARVEAFAPQQRFDTVITRAFSSLTRFVQKCRHLTAAGSRLVALKGRYPDEELESVLQAVTAVNVLPVQVPGLDAERHVVIIEP